VSSFLGRVGGCDLSGCRPATLEPAATFAPPLSPSSLTAPPRRLPPSPLPPTRSHIASLLNAGHLIPPLLHARADTSIRDNAGRTAEQLAQEKSSDEVLKQFAILAL
jgi:hypothetical protein